MKKICINKCYGGFSLSPFGIMKYAELKGIKEDSFYNRDIPRDDECLVKMVEDYGEKVNGSCAKLSIVEIPDYVKWVIDEYDGMERVEEEHQSWG